MTGAIFVAISMYQLTNVYADFDFWFLPARAWCLASDCRSSLFQSLPHLMTGSHQTGWTWRRRSSTRRAILAARSESQSPPTCSSTASSSTRAGSSSTPVEPAQYQTPCIRRRTISRAGLLPRTRSRGRLDRAAGAGPSLLFILHRRVLGADAALARRRAAGAEPALGGAARAETATGRRRLWRIYRD